MSGPAKKNFLVRFSSFFPQSKWLLNCTDILTFSSGIIIICNSSNGTNFANKHTWKWYQQWYYCNHHHPWSVWENWSSIKSDGSTVSYPSSCFLISDDLDLEDFVIVFKCFCTIVFKHDRTTLFFMRCVEHVVFDALRVWVGIYWKKKSK